MEKLTIDQILEKAFTSADLATGGLLEPTQSAKFVQGIIDNSVVIKECRREPMKGDKKQIDKITYGSDILQIPPAVGTAPTVTSKPVTSKVILDAKEVIVAIDLGYDSLEDSIEGQGLYNTILQLTQKEVAKELDILLLEGDAAGGTGTYLDILDGIFKQVTTYVLDAASATMSDTVAFNWLKLMPSKYYDVETDFRFYCSHLARLDYINALAGKGVNEAFVRYLIENKEPTYQGTPVRKVPAIQTYNIGGGSPVVNGSKGLLINPKNIIWGIHRDISYEFQRQPRKRIIEITMTMRMDVKLEEENAVVKAEDIKHSA
ncbi:hypothetical protein ACFL2J_05490 [Candidatus Omnitrophota bacterium]